MNSESKASCATEIQSGTRAAAQQRTLSTVGYGDIVPATSAGNIVVCVLIVVPLISNPSTFPGA